MKVELLPLFSVAILLFSSCWAVRDDEDYERLISDEGVAEGHRRSAHLQKNVHDARQAHHTAHQARHSHQQTFYSNSGSRSFSSAHQPSAPAPGPSTSPEGDKEDSGGDFSNAVTLLTAAVLIPSVVHLALKEDSTGLLTLKMLDVFVSVFFAKLWYSVWDQFLITFHVRQQFYGSAQLWSALVVIILYVATQAGMSNMAAADNLAGFYALRDVAGMTVGLALVSATNVAQLGVSQLRVNTLPIAGSFAVCLMTEIFARLVFGINYKLNLRDNGDQRVVQAVQEMEANIRALSTGFCIAQAIRHYAAGAYAPLGHDILANQGAGAQGFVTTFSIWLAIITIAGLVVVPRAKKLGLQAGRKYDMKAYLVMTVVWSYLLLFEFLLIWYKTQKDAVPPELATSIFATVTTAAALMKMAGFAQMYPDAGRTKDFRETRDLFIKGLAFAAAWAWGNSYKLGFDCISKRYQMGFKGLVPKLALALVVPIFMLPPYIKCLKPAQLREGDAKDSGDEGAASMDSAKLVQDSGDEGAAGLPSQSPSTTSPPSQNIEADSASLEPKAETPSKPQE